eukprot:Partr_v1_DN28554_c1_g1_i2_m72979 putative dienelactone hydrolase
MLIHESFHDLAVSNGASMRVHLFKPICADDVKLSAVIVFSEIYQVTGPLERLCRLLAGQLGVIAACPESYHEFEPKGKVLKYDKEGTDVGNAYKVKKEVAGYDADADSLVAYLVSRSDCTGRIGTVGMCLGGHLAFRCAMNEKVIAAACLFATDIHTGTLGKGGDNSLAQIPKLAREDKEMLMIWGKQDSHTPATGRALIHFRLVEAQVDFQWCELNARHAFIRDELSKGRYDPALTGVVMALVTELFQRRLVLGLPSTRNLVAQADAPGPQNC